MLTKTGVEILQNIPSYKQKVQHKISRNGLITSFVIKKKKLNLFDQEAEPAVSRQIAYVKIFDELKNQWYSDADTKMKIVIYSLRHIHVQPKCDLLIVHREYSLYCLMAGLSLVRYHTQHL